MGLLAGAEGQMFEVRVVGVYLAEIVHIGAVTLLYQGHDPFGAQGLLSDLLLLEGPAASGPQEGVLSLNASRAALTYNTYFAGSQKTAAMMRMAIFLLHTTALMRYLELLLILFSFLLHLLYFPTFNILHLLQETVVF